MHIGRGEVGINLKMPIHRTFQMLISILNFDFLIYIGFSKLLKIYQQMTSEDRTDSD